MPANPRKSDTFGAKRLFREIKWEVLKVHFLLQVLNTAILFFALNIVLTLFNMSFLWSVSVCILFFGYKITRGWKKNTLRRIEEGNPEVHEILRTAYEHRDTETLMVQGLIYDLQKALTTVSAGVLLNPKEIFLKFIAIALLAFTPVFIISFAPDIIQQNPLRDVDFSTLLSDQNATSFKDFFSTQLNKSDNIYGDSQLLTLGDQQLGIEVTAGGGTVDFTKTSDPSQKSFRFNDYPVDVQAQAAEESKGTQFTDSDVALINEYNCATKGICTTS